MNHGTAVQREVEADFAAADDLLAAAERGVLDKLGALRFMPSGRIGPLAEMLMAKKVWPSEMRDVSFSMPFARAIGRAIHRLKISGTGYQSRAGVFPLALLVSDQTDTSQWELWCMRAEQAAVAISFPKALASAMIGAMIELQENVHLHSGKPDTGFVAYAASNTHFEVVVADSGIGVLASLRENNEHGGLKDAGAALRVAISDGNSRLGCEGGHGYGMGQMFRALANYDGELRFRSDDYALIVRGHSPSLSGSVELRHKASLPGLTISVRCPAPQSVSQGL